MTHHLTNEQTADQAAEHDLTGEQPACTDELSSLRASIALLRATSTSLAEAHLAQAKPIQLPAPHRRRFAQNRPLLWAAAAAIVLVTVLPIELHHVHPSIAGHNSPAQPAGESDEALLDAINTDIAASVPAAMEPLADPLPSSEAAIPSTRTAPKGTAQ